MRILHTADWHLGKQLHGACFIEEQARVLHDFVDLACRERPDCIVIAGDIYDRAIPPIDAIALLDETLTRLSRDYKKPIIIISGNHDSPERLGFAASLLMESKLHLFGTYSTAAEPVIVSDRYGEVAFCPLPYLEPAVARHCLADPKINSHEIAIKSAVQRYKQKVKCSRSVLIAHAFAGGGQESDSERPLSIGGSPIVPIEHFSDFNYVALGHLHCPQTLGDGRIRYAGSLLKYSFSEIPHRKTHTLAEIGADGGVTIETIPISPGRDLRQLSATFDDIMHQRIELGSKDDYLVIELQDQGVILDAAARLRTVFPNLLHLKRPRLELRMNGDRPALRKVGELEIFKDFYQHVREESLNTEQINLLQSLIEELKRSEQGEL